MTEQLVTLSIIDFQSKLKKISSIMESNMEGDIFKTPILVPGAAMQQLLRHEKK